MTYKIESRINDGLREAPPHTVEVRTVKELAEQLLQLDSFTNDYGDANGVGSTVTITRIA